MNRVSSRWCHGIISGIIAAALPSARLCAQVRQNGAASYPIEHGQVLEQLIASKARAVQLDASRAAQASAGGVSATLIPAVQSQLPSTQAALEAGVILGQLKVGGSGGPVPAGEYHLYVSHAKTGWVAALEAGGKLATLSNDVIIDAHPAAPGLRKPVVRVVEPGSAPRTAISFEIETTNMKIRGTF